mmetsp:Transcript_57600/g.136954  ORF Transcript_57600/g.136954 Transcript_57600/m.136954 type:complete len:304 (+) Transcript_57600:110-1021(+)
MHSASSLRTGSGKSELSLNLTFTSEEFAPALSSGTLSDYGGGSAADVLRDASVTEHWRVTLERTASDRLGMRVASSWHGHALVITHIAVSGQLFRWNEDHRSSHLRCGDIITEVNGVTGEAGDLQNALQSAGHIIELEITRFVLVPALLDAADSDSGTLGLVVNGHFIVEDIDLLSAAAVHNHYVPPELWVRPGDRILSVNGHSDKATMRLLLETVANVELVLARPGWGMSPWEMQTSHTTSRYIGPSQISKATCCGLLGLFRSRRAAYESPSRPWVSYLPEHILKLNCPLLGDRSPSAPLSP